MQTVGNYFPVKGGSTTPFTGKNLYYKPDFHRFIVPE